MPGAAGPHHWGHFLHELWGEHNSGAQLDTCHLRKPFLKPQEAGATVSPVLQAWRLKLLEVISQVQFLRCFLNINQIWQGEVMDVLGCLESLINFHSSYSWAGLEWEGSFWERCSLTQPSPLMREVKQPRWISPGAPLQNWCLNLIPPPEPTQRTAPWYRLWQCKDTGHPFLQRNPRCKRNKFQAGLTPDPHFSWHLVLWLLSCQSSSDYCHDLFWKFVQAVLLRNPLSFRVHCPLFSLWSR